MSLMNYARDLFKTSQDASILKNHPAIPVIIDTLSRKENHHLVLQGIFSEKIQLALLESVALHLTEGSAPKSLRQSEMIFLNTKALSGLDARDIQQAFSQFCDTISAEKTMIFVLNQFDSENPLGKLLQGCILDPRFRLIILNGTAKDFFVTLKLTDISDAERLFLLKSYKTELEEYHHVLIADETFAAALSLSAHYLSMDASFEKSFELLDSASARASSDDQAQSKPIVTPMTLMQVIASLTEIPVSHLHHAVFHSTKFIEILQKQIYGQDAALGVIANALQQTCIQLHEKKGPLCNFLFAGPAETGKTTVVIAMAEHLFGTQKALVRINLEKNFHSLADMQLFSKIRERPYSIILIENIHHAPAATVNLFKNILTLGCETDENGHRVDFSRAIIVMTTTFGSERIAAISQTPANDSGKTLDLMQLVLSERKTETTETLDHRISTEELCEELLPILEGYFSAALLQNIHIVPFLPLDYAAVEKITRLKIKALAKQLEWQFGIELSYAPEVIKFLAHEAVWRKSTKSLTKIFDQNLYSAVSNEILAHADDKNRPKRLALQLNDDGQLLRCEFMSSMGTPVYN